MKVKLSVVIVPSSEIHGNYTVICAKKTSKYAIVSEINAVDLSLLSIFIVFHKFHTFSSGSKQPVTKEI